MSAKQVKWQGGTLTEIDICGSVTENADGYGVHFGVYHQDAEILPFHGSSDALRFATYAEADRFLDVALPAMERDLMKRIERGEVEGSVLHVN